MDKVTKMYEDSKKAVAIKTTEASEAAVAGLSNALGVDNSSEPKKAETLGGGRRRTRKKRRRKKSRKKRTKKRRKTRKKKRKRRRKSRKKGGDHEGF